MSSQVDTSRRFFIKTLGCKVNQYESQAMRESLVAAGFVESMSEEIADIFIINTCTVTRHADKESRYFVSLFHKLNPNAKIVVAGCYVEHDASDISFLPGVSHIVKNRDKSRITGILEGQREEASGGFGISDFKGRAKAFVKIQDGCENFCSYCKVPLVRGACRSKPIAEILDEVSTLAANGFEEMILAGICLGSWGKDLSNSANLVDVLNALGGIRGDFRVRLSSLEPAYVTDELVAFISNNEWLCRHLHIPLQSGDDDVLKKMKRSYTTKEFLSIVDKARSKIKGLAITTDVMVGFPGESEANFKNTLRTIKEMRPARTHIFTFSKRKGTSAYDMDNAVEEGALKRRYITLKVAVLEASYLYRRDFIGDRLDVLVETKRDKHTGLLKGYSDNYINILFDGVDDIMKKIVSVRIDYANLTYTLGSYE